MDTMRFILRTWLVGKQFDTQHGGRLFLRELVFGNGSWPLLVGVGFWHGSRQKRQQALGVDEVLCLPTAQFRVNLPQLGALPIGCCQVKKR
jgi:hypothetical protein